MLVLWILFVTGLSVFLSSTGLGFYLYYFAETVKKVDYTPIIFTSLITAWATLAVGTAICEENEKKKKS